MTLANWHYFIVMRDFGSIGREAVVDPQHTRRDIVGLIATREWEDVIFVHEVRDGTVTDVTEEIMAEAELENA